MHSSGNKEKMKNIFKIIHTCALNKPRLVTDFKKKSVQFCIYKGQKRKTSIKVEFSVRSWNWIVICDDGDQVTETCDGLVSDAVEIETFFSFEVVCAAILEVAEASCEEEGKAGEGEAV